MWKITIFHLTKMAAILETEIRWKKLGNITNITKKFLIKYNTVCQLALHING